MADLALAVLPALPTSDGSVWQRNIGDVTLRAIEARTITTFAYAPAQADALGAALHLPLPATGQSTSGAGEQRLLGMQADQLWLLDDDGGAPPDVAGIAWRTDQSDGWASLAVAGLYSLAVLERLVPLDLAHFEPGQVARTVVEHLAAIVLRTDTDRFELLTPRSSVHAFAHALETAASQAVADRALHDPVVPEN